MEKGRKQKKRDIRNGRNEKRKKIVALTTKSIIFAFTSMGCSWFNLNRQHTLQLVGTRT